MEDVAAFGTGNPDATATSKQLLADGDWHLVTATRFINQEAGKSELKVYVDGTLSAIAISDNISAMDKNDSFEWGDNIKRVGSLVRLMICLRRRFGCHTGRTVGITSVGS